MFSTFSMYSTFSMFSMFSTEPSRGRGYEFWGPKMFLKMSRPISSREE